MSKPGALGLKSVADPTVRKQRCTHAPYLEGSHKRGPARLAVAAAVGRSAVAAVLRVPKRSLQLLHLPSPSHVAPLLVFHGAF